MYIRVANHSDSKELFSWRNDPFTRKASINTSIVEWEDHEKWFYSILQDSNVTIFIIEELAPEKSSLGMCRFNIVPDSDMAEVSINLNPKERGKGIAKKILHGCIEDFVIQNPDIKFLEAMIREENYRSMKIFVSENFVPQRTHEGVVQLKLDLKG